MGYEFEELSGKILQAAVTVHRTLGPGFIESIYENALVIALRKLDLKVEQQKCVPIFYEEIKVGEHRLDLLVEEEMIDELKSVETFEKIHFAITKSYLHALKKEVGLLLNFNSTTLQIKRVVLTK
jgi:GxxExxY protein